MKLSKHFNDYELLSPNLLAFITERNASPKWYVNENQILALEHIRAYFGKLVYVNLEVSMRRGICTDQECLDVGRNITSQHCRQGAFDITVQDITPTEVGELIKEIAPIYKIGGLGVNEAHNFTHFDFRNTKRIIIWEY